MRDWKQIARSVRIVGFLLVFAWAVWQTGVAQVERSQKNDVIEVLKRRSPVTDYQAAEFAHNDCRKNYEDAYLAAIGRLVTTGPADRVALGAEVDRLTGILSNIESNCPTPQPPQFSDDGKLLRPPVIPATTASTVPPAPTSKPAG